MAIKLIVLLFGALLLAQNSYAAPRPESESKEDLEGNPFKAVIERFKLLEITLDELTELYKIVTEKGESVFKKVLQDPKVLEVKTDAMVANTAKIQKLADQLQESGKESSLFEFLDEFGEIMTKFDKEKNENLSEEDEIVQKSLYENGLTELETAIIDNFKKFFEKFSKEVEQYISGLDEKEKKEEEKLITWFEKLKVEEDFEKRFDLFDTFFTEMSDSSSSESNE